MSRLSRRDAQTLPAQHAARPTPPDEDAPLDTLLPHARLLLPDRAADLDRLRGRLADDRALAVELARRGWVTLFQARWLARGHGRRLFVGRYVLLDRLGGGGMGYVFLAVHRGLDRKAAVKVIRPDRAEQGAARARFAREVRALARVSHPNVVHAYDAGVHRRSLYLAMEYVRGPDLARVLARTGPLDSGRACEYARQAALGLHHLHGCGIVHRDVKPGNLILAGGGLVKLLDVGLAREETADDEGLTRAGVLVGTPDYAAPEQVADSRRTTPRTDQYGLGCTLYHLLTGQVPFPDGNPVEKALRRLTESPPAVESLRPDLPPGLGAVVGRLLARRPRDRFASMVETAAALAPYAAPASAGDTRLSLPTVPNLPALPEADTRS